jgi:hypothetical protein
LQSSSRRQPMHDRRSPSEIPPHRISTWTAERVRHTRIKGVKGFFQLTYFITVINSNFFIIIVFLHIANSIEIVFGIVFDIALDIVLDIVLDAVLALGSCLDSQFVAAITRSTQDAKSIPSLVLQLCKFFIRVDPRHCARCIIASRSINP